MIRKMNAADAGFAAALDALLAFDNSTDTRVDAAVTEVLAGVRARGDRRVAAALLRAHEMGGSKAFRRAMREAQLDPAFYLYRERSPDRSRRRRPVRAAAR